jgi:Cytochrome C oxidase subunit II, transmembrane domain/GIY-YIG catalytic domain
MIIVNFDENLTTDLILKNSTNIDFKELEPMIVKGGYGFEDYSCGDTCSSGRNHNRIELSDKMTTIELNEINSNILSDTSILDIEKPEINLSGYDYEDCMCNGVRCTCGQELGSNDGGNEGGGNDDDNNNDDDKNKDVVKKSSNNGTKNSSNDNDTVNKTKAKSSNDDTSVKTDNDKVTAQIVDGEINAKSEILDNMSTDSIIVHDLNNIVIDNLILGQPDINIPLIALRISVIILIGLWIEVWNAWGALRIKNKSSFGWKKDYNKSGPKFLDAVAPRARDTVPSQLRWADAPVSWGLYFQDAASPSFEGIVDLHNRIMFYLVVILFGVSWVLLSVISNFNNSNNKLVYRHLNHGKFVPIQKYSKFKNNILKIKGYSSLRFYTTLCDNSLNKNEINYVQVYHDAYNRRKNILEENKGKSGIYMIANKLTNDIYIGQSVDISKRFRKYFNLSYI